MTAPNSPLSRVLRWLRWCFAGAGVLLLLALLGLVFLIYRLWQEEAPVSFDTARAAEVQFGGWTPLVPGPGLPEDLRVGAANNNVDVARFGGDYFMAWRSSPNHFASAQTRLIVARSADRQQWSVETVVQLEESDLREPRFLELNGELFLYFFRAGNNPLGFEPKYIHMMARDGDGAWSEPAPIYEPGYVIWRARAHHGVGYMSVYHGAGLYTLDDRPGEIRLLRSTDGRTWTNLSEAPQVTTVSAEEGEFIFDGVGNLHATVRLETQGSLVCRADARDLSTWECRYTPHKMDSALLLRDAGKTWVIARRNVAGEFPRGPAWWPERWRRGWSLAAYSLTRKRTALYAFDAEALTCTPVMDFPSRGDTAFPAAARLDDGSFWLVNYSNDPERFDGPWLWGQLNPTQLYAGELRLSPAPAPEAPEAQEATSSK